MQHDAAYYSAPSDSDHYTEYKILERVKRDLAHSDQRAAYAAVEHYMDVNEQVPPAQFVVPSQRAASIHNNFAHLQRLGVLAPGCDTHSMRSLYHSVPFHFVVTLDKDAVRVTMQLAH
jgi:hypothetical protein